MSSVRRWGSPCLFPLQLFSLCWVLSVAQSKTVRYSTFEEDAPGTVIGTLAEDLHMKVSGDTSFRLMKQFNSSLLRVREGDGQLTVGDAGLDRERLCGQAPQCVLAFDVVSFSQEQFRLVHVEVEVRDVNDHAPRFPRAQIPVEGWENTCEYLCEQEDLLRLEFGNAEVPYFPRQMVKFPQVRARFQRFFIDKLFQALWGAGKGDQSLTWQSKFGSLGGAKRNRRLGGGGGGGLKGWENPEPLGRIPSHWGETRATWHLVLAIGTGERVRGAHQTKPPAPFTLGTLRQLLYKQSADQKKRRGEGV
ncbi:Hypothetical predicted protein [Marmota monax]|uniref:Cadherin domain-containing protein n=1 Tax=Marmota monax TaxID=9995 RepID=A0A5E4CD22_MARMO|nr:Hypothetical predicted protein [Marmota monax]